jgi:hypothetical protein
MNEQDINKITLSFCYESYFSKNYIACLSEFCEQNNWDKSEYDKILYRLSKQDLIKSYASGGLYIITSDGILYCEENNIAPAELTKKMI